jgi:4-diphosphocytidyl-2-C-methyl-D-erythritol kinase
MTRLTALAPAKINRELRVGRLRSDGYHEVRSRMVSIDLADRLSVEEAATLEFACDDPAVPSGETNLVVRAARLLARSAGVPARARVTLEKRIPTGGGLGGGSADAAVALQLLARLWGLSADPGALQSVAERLGSDVPFFLAGGEAEVTGRGEVVTPVEDSAPVELVLLVPPFSVSTAAVYRKYAGRGELPERLAVDQPGRRAFLGPNDLAPAVLGVEPRMEKYVKSAAALTPDNAISGSGATVVLHGAPPDAAAILATRHPEARVLSCRTLTRAEYRSLTDPAKGAP